MIDGMDKLLKHIEKIANISLERPVNRATQYVQSAAKSMCPALDGELRESILTATDHSAGMSIGVCYTNKSYAPYVEFGTGPKGQAKHNGISPNVPVAYTQSPWWIHESQINPEVAERYHWFHIDTPDGRFYQCTGQAAQPFMYPALKNNEKEVRNIIMEGIKEQLK